MAEALLSGWGRTAPTRAEVVRPRSPDEVAQALRAAPPRGVIARGLGRAYGDAAQNAGGLVLDMTALNRIHSVADGTAVVDAGVGLDALARALVPLGHFVAVTPGTSFVTVGGAIASDVHGKNHHVDGSFGLHVEWLELVLPSGETRRLEPGDDAFHATLGGMGLTGVVTRAALKLLAIETTMIRVDTERAGDLDDVLDRMAAGDHRYRYSVAWIDCLARGAALGRSVLTRGDHATREELPEAERDAPLSAPPAGRLAAPPWVPAGLLRRPTLRAFNELWFRKAPREERGRLESYRSFFYPLDGVRDWNRLYGSEGFLQHQVIVPFGAEDVLRRVVERLAAESCVSLAVLKRFGEEAGLLSFPRPGWTLAADLPAGLPELSRLLDELDELVASAGGRVYFAKDSRMRADHLHAMYPELPRWREIRDALDPERRLTSDLDRRLGLTA